MTQKRERNETGCRTPVTKDGRFSPHINSATTTRLTKYCKRINMNRTKFVEECINARLDALEEEYLQNLSREELIEMVRGM